MSYFCLNTVLFVTRDERRERIVAECNAVRQALQDLLHEYMANVSYYTK